MSIFDDVPCYYFTLPMLLDGGYQRFASEEEKAKAARFYDEGDRLMSLYSHGFLRFLLSRDLGCHPAGIRLDPGPNGKPVLADGGKKIFFNLSHSGTSGLCALSSQHELGIDLEAVRPFRPGHLEWIVEDFFAPHEKGLWESLPQEERLDFFFRSWVRKEAAAKAMGTGLAFPLDQLDVSGILRQPVRVRGVDPEELRLTVRDIPVPAPYVAAICFKRLVDPGDASESISSSRSQTHHPRIALKDVERNLC